MVKEWNDKASGILDELMRLLQYCWVKELNCSMGFFWKTIFSCRWMIGFRSSCTFTSCTCIKTKCIIVHFNYVTEAVEAEKRAMMQKMSSGCFLFSLDLRLQLLDEAHNHYLLKSLYGLLMLLPQSDAFHILQHRLQCIPSVHFSSVETR